jgi:PRTRC genetic system ParB family protein
MQSTKLEVLPLASLVPGRNPRTHFDATELQELAASIAVNGVAQPILVRPLDQGFQIIAGERRVRASRLALGEGASIPAMVHMDCDDAQADVLALSENTIRANMSATEEALAAQALVVRSKGDKAEAAALLGWPLSRLERRLALLNLVPEARAALDRRAIRLGHAELLAAVAPEKQAAALEKIIEHDLTTSQVKAQLASLAQNLSAAVFDLVDCGACPYNSSVQRTMFEESIGSDAACTNPTCWGNKTSAWIGQRKQALAETFPRVVVLEPGISTPEPIRLEAQGRFGVGDQQALACRGCANFGATLSVTGAVEEGLCFEASCHTVKVAAHLKSKTADAPAQKTPGSTDRPATKPSPKTSGTSVPAEPAPLTITVTGRLREHKIAVWRSVLARFTYSNPNTAIAVLLALGLSSRSRHVDSTKLAQALVTVAPEVAADSHAVSRHDIGHTLGVTAALSEPARAKLLHAMAASAFKDIDEAALTACAKALAVKLTDFWQLDEATLSLLTKSEMWPMAVEVGLETALGGAALKKALAKPKAEAIKTLLGVDGFDYRVQPAFMQI